MNFLRASALAAIALISVACGGGDGITVHENNTCTPSTLSFPGNSSGSLTSGGCLLNGKPAKYFRFTSTGTSLTSFTATTAFAPEIAVTNDPATEFVTFSGASPLSALWQLPAGTYQFRLVSTQGSVGTYTVAAASASTSGCAPRAILPFASATYSETLTTADCLLSVDHSYYDIFYIYSSKACTITMHSSNSVDAYLLASNARTHEVLQEDGSSGGGTDAQFTFSVCNASGDPLEIWPNSFTDVVGPYTLTVTIPGATLRAGEPVLTLPGANTPGDGTSRQLTKLLRKARATP